MARILIVEDELFVAVDLESLVQTHHASAQIVICVSVAEAQAALDEPVSLALLDIDVLDGKTYSVASRLHQKGIPIIFVSGSRPSELPPDLSDVPFIPKPFTASAIRDALLRIGK